MSTFTLSGTGIQAIASPGSLAVTVTVLPGFPNVGNANPTNYYHLGLLRLGNTHGYLQARPIDAVSQLIPCPTGMTQLGYALATGVTITVEERPEVPYAGPTGPPGPTGPTGASGGTASYMLYQDHKASGTNGGTFTSGAWRTRDLNTEVVDQGSHGVVASNQLTLDAGTYIVRARCPAQQVNNHQARLQDITHGATLLTGSSMMAFTGAAVGNNDSVIEGAVVLTGTTVVELQHQCWATQSGNGFGSAAAIGGEVFSSIELWRQ